MGIISWPCSHSLFPRLGVSSLSDLYYAKQHFWTMFWYGIDSEHYHGRVPEVFLFPVSSCGSSLITPYSSYRLISACSYSLSGLKWDCSISGEMEAAATAISSQVILFLLLDAPTLFGSCPLVCVAPLSTGFW